MFFGSTIKLLAELQQRYPHEPRIADASAYLVGEFSSRLRQLSVLYTRIEILNDYLNSKDSPPASYRRQRWEGREPKPFDPSLDMISELLLWVDCFYFVAWRALEIVQGRPGILAHVRRIGAPGIRNVRNHLLQHPERADSGALELNWSIGGPDGPRMKPHAHLPRKTSFKDLGLFANAREFRDNIEAALREAIESKEA